MNNRKKAFIALAVGTMLVGSTGTTLALWHTSDPIAAGTHQTGELGLSFVGGNQDPYDQVLWRMTAPNGTYRENHDFRELGFVAPGYVLTGKAQVRSNLHGTNLVANLKRDLHYQAAAGEGVNAEVASWLNEASKIVAITALNGSPVTEATVLDSTTYHNVTITITFPTRALPGATQYLQTASLHLGDLELNLVQVRQ